MSELTPQNAFPYPAEFEEPYFPSIKGYFLANDMAIWSLSENDNLIWAGGGTFAWSASSGLLAWSSQIEIRAKTTPYKVIIPGPPSPGGQVTLNDGECAFFQLPRLLIADQLIPVPLTIGPISLIPGVRLCDIKILACRIGTTVFLPNGASINDGQSGIIFGGGIGTTITPHEHQPAVIIEPVSAGVSTLDLNIASFAPALLKKVQLYRNGQLLESPDDYTVNLSTGIVTLVVPTIRPNISDPNPERFVALDETSPPVITTGNHQHLAALVIEPIAGTFQLDMLVNSLDYPALGAVSIFRNGEILSAPADYTLNLTTGLVTLVTPSVAGERFVALREVEF
jgi:hypothetical protein